MGIRYGNESQFTAFFPECGYFADHPSLHWAIVVYLPVVEISAVLLNGWVIHVLVSGGESNKLLQQSQHVYVLGSAVTNVLCAFIGMLGFWFDQFVFPCVYKGLWVCAFKNTFHQGGGFQLVFNVALVCYDRYRLVKLGASYDHKKEVRRAKWGLVLTGMASFLLFAGPEVAIPLVTGNLFEFTTPQDALRCRMTQAQKYFLITNIALGIVPQSVDFLDGKNFVDILSIIMIVAPFCFIAYYTSLATYLLVKMQRKAAASGTSQMADFRKVVRAMFVMFGMVAALMIVWFPFGFGLLLFEVNNDAISWTTIMVLIVLLDAAPLLDPFAFAITLPKLRERARQTAVGRLFMKVLTLNINSKASETASATRSATNRPSVLTVSTSRSSVPSVSTHSDNSQNIAVQVEKKQSSNNKIGVD